MKNTLALSLVALLAACGPASTGAPAAPSSAPVRPEKTAGGEPAVVTVHHVLIAFAGAERSKATRTRAEAQKLVYEVIGRIRAGEDFEKLAKEFSDDPGGGPYTMANHGIEPAGAREFERKGMARAFGDVSFRLAVGEIGVADHDPATSPFGWHIIKRLK